MMPDDYGVPQAGDAEDYQQFMPGIYDLIADASEIALPERAIELLQEARGVLLADFERRHPGYGKGRAVWQ